jgi:hypothetical protein
LVFIIDLLPATSATRDGGALAGKSGEVCLMSVRGGTNERGACFATTSSM